MSRKLNFVPPIPNYRFIRTQMEEDLKYRLTDRHHKTSLGRPLYQRINVQIVMTQECPYHCPFCLERKHPMKGMFDAGKQIESLKKVLAEHPDARLTITGGEPGLYPEHVKNLLDTFKQNSNGVFSSINTSGYSTSLNGMTHINLSVNDYVKPNPDNFPHCTYQTVLTDENMNVDNLKKIMDDNSNVESFSFRFLSGVDKKDYDVSIFNNIQNDKDFTVSTFRIGDFFVYLTFDYNGHHGRVTLGDMYQQMHNDYQDGYSNIIIHPDGRIGINWN